MSSSTSDPSRSEPEKQNQQSAEEIPDQPENAAESEHNKAEDASEDDDEEGECGFCLFMKAGECRESFVNWEDCVKEVDRSSEDLAEKCSEVTSILMRCMQAHSDYYQPILRVEKDVEAEAAMETDLRARDSSVVDSESSNEQVIRNDEKIHR